MQQLHLLQIEDTNILNQLRICVHHGLHMNLSLLMTNKKDSILEQEEIFQEFAESLGGSLQEVMEVLTKSEVPPENKCLHNAAEKGQLVLLKAARNKEPRDEAGLTPLHLAAEHNQVEAIHYLGWDQLLML